MICHYFKFFNITLKEKKKKKNPRVHQNFQNPANLLRILYFKVEKTPNLIKKRHHSNPAKKSVCSSENLILCGPVGALGLFGK
jgi:hypothetical protein